MHRAHRYRRRGHGGRYRSGQLRIHLFTGAFGLHGGLEKIGCAIIPISSGNTERQINIMRDFGSTVLIATPSYALYMAEVAERMDALKDIRLRVDANQGYSVETRSRR